MTCLHAAWWKKLLSLVKITGLHLSPGSSPRQHQLESLRHRLFLEQLDNISVSKEILPEALLLKLYRLL
jgi:hypothetical protein